MATPFNVALMAESCNKLMFCRKEVRALGPEVVGEDDAGRGVVQS